MKEFIWNLIQRMGTFFTPKHEKQMQVEKTNGNIRKLQQFLLERFDFRYNQLTGVTEYRPKEPTSAQFLPIDERNMNGMIVDARLKGVHLPEDFVFSAILQFPTHETATGRKHDRPGDFRF